MRKLLPEYADEMRRLYWDEGLTMEEVAGRYGVTRQTVLRYFYQHGIPSKPVGPRKGCRQVSSMRDELMRLRTEGMTLKDIAREYDVTPEAVSKWMVRCGLAMDRREGARIAHLKRRIAGCSNRGRGVQKRARLEKELASVYERYAEAVV